MTTPLTYSGAPVPTSGETPDFPADLLAFGNGLDQLVVLKATSQSNRDSLYANVSAGTLVSCASLQKVWMKTTTPPTAAAWITLAEVGTAATSGVITPATTDWSVSAQWAQRLNGFISFRIQLAYSGATLTAGSDGNIGDTTIGTIQSSWRINSAAGYWPVAGTTNVMTMVLTIGTDGSVILRSMVPNGTIQAGHVLAFAATYPGA